MAQSIPQPSLRPCIFDWMQSNLVGNAKASFLTLADVYNNVSGTSKSETPGDSRWDSITPRTMMFKKFFEQLRPRTNPSQFVVAMYSCGIESKILETLPEAVLAPIRDAISACQPQPPSSWSSELLELVNRSDISLALNPGKYTRHPAASLLVSHSRIPDLTFRANSSPDTHTSSGLGLPHALPKRGGIQQCRL